MKSVFILAFVLLLCKPSFSQMGYVFNGNGSWKVAANWLNNLIPPSLLPTGDSIIIDPSGTGECILDTSQTISQGAKLVVRPDKNFRVSGNLTQVVPTEGTFIDSRDGKVYPYKTIGTQVWMTKNLNYTAAFGSWCHDSNPDNCAVYGRLYEWDTAMTVAPKGWHIPSDAEWTTLITYLGGESVAGGKMKDTTLWKSPNTGATNSSGFTALPGGMRYNNIFSNLGEYGIWWSSTLANSSLAFMRMLRNDDEEVGRSSYQIEEVASVRCIRD